LLPSPVRFHHRATGGVGHGERRGVPPTTT
jgi:hypothetical protein